MLVKPFLVLRLARSDKKQQARNHWHLLCYALHAFLVAIHVILLGIAVSNHVEHRIIILFDSETFTLGLSVGLQAFYTVRHAVNFESSSAFLNELIHPLSALHGPTGLRHTKINVVGHLF